MNFQPRELEQIRRWGDRLKGEVVLRLIRTPDDRTARLESFCDALARAVPSVKVIRQKGEEDELLPALRAGDRCAFHAVPEGTELGPFLELLTLQGEEPGRLAEKLPSGAASVEWATRFKLYVSPHCPHCPQMVKLAAPLPLVNPLFQTSVIDAGLFPEQASQDGVQAVPTLLVDDEFRWTGVVAWPEILDVLTHRDPAQMSPATFKNMLKEGQASRVAEMMLERDEIFAAFPKLVAHPEWSVRLGALVVMEELTESRPDLARRALGPLWEELDGAADPVKGDILYLYGELGGEEWVAPLEKLLSESPSEELKPVLEEALEKLRGE